MLERVTRIVSIGTIMLILVGVFNLQQKYYWWDIKIFDYADVSEILISFNEVLMTISFILVAIGLSLATLVGYAAGSAAVNTPGKVVTVADTLENAGAKKIGCWLTFIAVVSTLIWLILPTLYIIDIQSAAKWNALWFDGSYLLVFCASLPLVITTKKENNQKIEPDSIIIQMMFSAFLSLVIFFFIRNYFTYSLKHSGTSKLDVTLTFNDGSQLLTTKDRLYIDQTKNFMFFRELSSKKNLVVGLKNVSNIETKQNHKGL